MKITASAIKRIALVLVCTSALTAAAHSEDSFDPQSQVGPKSAAA